MKPLRSLCLALFLAAGLAHGLRAQVQASLVSENGSIQPGTPFTVALRLVHQTHWHTYWVNPGTGLATSLAWTLPAGWKAGDIQWPAPEVLKDDTGAIVGNGYEGDLLLPVTITPPADAAPGTSVTLKATATWLMCKDVCKPGKAEVALTLPVLADPPKADPEFGAKIQTTLNHLPRTDPQWDITATRDGSKVTLHLQQTGRDKGDGSLSRFRFYAEGSIASHEGPSGSASSTPVSSLLAPLFIHFFADDNLIGYELPQTVTPDGDGRCAITLAVSPDGPQNSTRLVGVLTSDKGWRLADSSSIPALRVDVPFTSASEQAAADQRGQASPLTPAASVNGQDMTPSPPSSLLGTLLLAFVGGMILNLMPCVFPVLGIKVLGFVNQAGGERRKVVEHGLVFTAGVLLSFWTLAGLLAVLRAGGAQLGWGFQLQSPAFVFALAAGMLVFALNMSGVFEIGLSATAVGGDLQMKSGLGGSFFTGILATVVATPCSAPFLAPALGAALALSTAQSFLIFTVIAIGLSTPYLLLSIFPGAVKVLPRPGAWMETFKQFMAFPLYATVGYLLWVLAGQVEETALLGLMFGLVVVAMGIWVYGRWRAPGASAGRARFGLVAGLGLVAVGAWAGWPHPPSPTEIVWAKWSPETVAQLRAENRIVYVDFTARWCATCQANKKLVFHSDDVLRAFRDRHVATLRGDWTNQDPAITAELAKYHRSAVPFNVIWLPGHDDPVVLPSLLTPGIVLDAIKG
jgi:thiol:disulfide interchange protein DsbD